MPSQSPLRQVSRDAVRVQIAETALLLFLERGFEQTTVDDIAAAVGMSQRTFFRYFATKEDVVLLPYERTHHEMLAIPAARPPEEDIWETLGVVCAHAIRSLFMDTHETGHMRRLQGIVGGSDLLFASYLRRHNHLEEQLTDRLVAREAERASAQLIDRVAVRALVGAAFANLHAVVSAVRAPHQAQGSDTRLLALMHTTRPTLLAPAPSDDA